MEGLEIEITFKHVLVFISVLLCLVSLVSFTSCVISGKMEQRDSLYMKKAFFNAHSYIVCNDLWGKPIGFVHDPDCKKCFKAKEEGENVER